MMVVSEIRTQQEFDEIKFIMEVFVVNRRIKQIARSE